MNRSVILSLISTAGTVVMLSGCGGGDSPVAAPTGTEAPTGSLGDEIVIDPALAGGKAAAPAPQLSAEQRSPAAIEAARQEAAKLVGGSIEVAPAATSGDSAPLASSAANVNPSCTDKVEHSPAWASSLPDALGVYPKAVVQEAAGTDRDGCRLRIVTFVTPVPPQDVINFYFTRARKAGYDAQHRLDGTDHVLGGAKARGAYVIYVRKLDSGLTEVDLVSNAS